MAGKDERGQVPEKGQGPDDQTPVTDATPTDATPVTGSDDSPESYTPEYVAKLRAENAKWRTQLREKERAEKERADAELKEQERWKELAEKHEAELQAEKHRRLRLEVATAKGLPVELAARLQGSDKAELEADADTLLTFAKPTEGKGVPASGGKRAKHQPLDLDSMTAAEIRDKKQEIWAQEHGG